MAIHYRNIFSTTGCKSCCGISLGKNSVATSIATEVTCKSCLKSQVFRSRYPDLALPDHKRNPCIANLTNAGKGRPPKGLIRVTIGLDPDLIEKIDEVAVRTKQPRNDVIADMCKRALNFRT